MADGEVLNRIEKQNEGITLGLGALAEVLQKMDARLSKQDESEAAEAAAEEAATEEEELEAMYKSLVRDVSKSVTRNVGRRLQKQDNPMAELNQGKSKKVSGTPWPMSSASKASIEETGEETLDNSDTESVQMPIEAMEKMVKTILEKGGYLRKDDEEEIIDDIENEEHENGNGEEELYPVEEQDDAIDEPILEDEEEGTNMEAMVRNMQKQMATLKKQNASLKKGMETTVRKETETRLRKMGFREEKGLAGIKKSSTMGASEPIVKSAGTSDEVVDQLASLSWNELNEMRFRIESGDTDGVPRELLG